MSPPRTRKKNATTHPGAIVLATQRKRRTKSEKQADDEHAAAEKAAAEKAEQDRVVTIAKMVMELRAKGQSTAAPVSHHDLCYVYSKFTYSITYYVNIVTGEPRLCCEHRQPPEQYIKQY